MNIDFAKHEHLDRICQIIDNAKGIMAASGIDQWQNGYPCRTDFEKDIENKDAFVMIEDGHPIGVFALRLTPEPSYEEIDGDWLTDTPYATIHRSAIHSDFRGKGIMSAIVDFSCKLAAANGMSSLRIDTHENNKPMQRALMKSGFEYCGVILLVDGVDVGGKRLAYEKTF